MRENERAACPACEAISYSANAFKSRALKKKKRREKPRQPFLRSSFPATLRVTRARWFKYNSLSKSVKGSRLRAAYSMHTGSHVDLSSYEARVENNKIQFKEFIR